MKNNTAISVYPDAKKVIKDLDQLIETPIYGISQTVAEEYVKEYFEKKCTKSHSLHQQASTLIPSGIQHNLAFNFPFPLAIDKATGPFLYDVDGNRYFDFLQSGGPILLGNNPERLLEKAQAFLAHCGPVTGLFHEYEYLLAKKIQEHIPSVEKFRMLGSGNEAAMAAIRVARLATGKKYILKMGGAYHGWSDQLAYSLRVPYSKNLLTPGIPRNIFRYTQEFFPNQLEDLEHILKKNRLRGGTAAIFMEPLGPESGTRPLLQNFNKEVEFLARKFDAALIFDEVVTAFRLGMGGAQEYFNIKPDLTLFGKIMGGGYPSSGGLGGSDHMMKHLGAGLTDMEVKSALVGGTMAANPLTSYMGYETICEIEKTRAWEKSAAMGDLLTVGLKKLAVQYDLPFVIYNFGSIVHLQSSAPMHFFINWRKPWSLPHLLKETTLRKEALERMGAAFMAEGLITLAGSRIYLSAAYTEDCIQQALNGFEKVFQKIKIPGKDS
jgi:glutamate-1-semialdehyde 2,1-aminomutase